MQIAFDDPALFPERIDWKNGLVRLIRVERDVLRTSAFLDGRTALAEADSTPVVIGFDRFVEAAGNRPPNVGWILHEGFCGSTLLAQLMTIETKGLCLSEPQILVDLSNWKAATEGGQSDLFREVLRATLAKLSCRWTIAEAVLVKPSNWVNTLAADILSCGPVPRVAVVRIEVEPFLVAVLRGGRERLSFVMALYAHMARARPDLAAAAEAAMEPESDALQTAFTYIAATHWVQRRILKEMGAAMGFPLAHISVDYPDWLELPHATIDRLSALANVPVPAEDADRSIAERLGSYSKDGRVAFDPVHERMRDAGIRAQYRLQFERAARYIERLTRL